MSYKKKRRLVRQFKRRLRRFLLFPARIPRLSVSTFDVAQKVCEFSGIVLVVMLIAAMVSKDEMARAGSIVSLIVFVLSFLVIELRIYQDDLMARGYMGR
ncbi:MAG: hypothetical protein K6B28_04230 [Lachnospiraceae bacterium]|nr:hypothetical protein [Lachnospiraceae bacterium]